MNLIDSYQRSIKYIRLSVADKCNMRCFYCIPRGFNDFETPENWLSFAEIERVLAIFAQMGVSHIRLTGGEPLVRKNLSVLVKNIAQIDGIDDLSLSTNAALLGTQAADLKRAGLARINVSLDTLKPERFKKITGSDIQPVLDGLQAASAVNLSPVKINMVAMKGLNDDEFDDMLQYCITQGFILRFIETMPIGNSGKNSEEDYYLDLAVVKKQLTDKYDLIPATFPGGGPATYYKVAGTDFNVGFITPMSQHFCATCNRVRLSVDGVLYLCLGQNDKLELRPLLRNGADDLEIAQRIRAAIDDKPEKHDFSASPGKIVRLMSQTGG